MTNDVTALKQQFPILASEVHNHPLVYLDNAATTQKPIQVIDAISTYYKTQNANVHRGIHRLSELATHAFEETRQKYQKFINAKSSKECIFTRGTTEAVNLVAYSFGEKYVQPGDEILISQMEHHSNIVPWQLLCQRKNATLKFIPLTETGELDLSQIDTLLTNKTRLVSVVHVSNSLGTINPIKTIIDKAHQKDIPVMIDGAQSLAHLQVDVQDLDCDFYTCSAHKMYGPTGIGVLYGKEKYLDAMPPYHGGGEMILEVTMQSATYNVLPHKFEAGTPAIADVIGLGAAIDFLNQMDRTQFLQMENNLRDYATTLLNRLPGIKMIGTATDKIAVLSFTLDGIHPHDIGTILDQKGIAIRSGHHCTMPVMDFFQVPATTRASIGIYNTEQDIEQLISGLQETQKLFKKA